MNSKICEMFDIEFPLFAFSHCRDVVAAVSKAGGFGVFGAVNISAQELGTELSWIDQNVGGKPYGLDLIVPNSVQGKGENLSEENMLSMVPAEQKQFAATILEEHGVDAHDLDDIRKEQVKNAKNLLGINTAEILQVAFEHPIKLIANALGVPPQSMLDAAQAHGVPVGALVGSKEHALAQVANGVDILVVAGGEAGGHCGDVSTMVLVPEVCQALDAENLDTPVLAAGGIATGGRWRDRWPWARLGHDVVQYGLRPLKLKPLP